MIPKKPAPDLFRGGRRFSEKIMLIESVSGLVLLQPSFCIDLVDAAGPADGATEKRRPDHGCMQRQPGGCRPAIEPLDARVAFDAPEIAGDALAQPCARVVERIGEHDRAD